MRANVTEYELTAPTTLQAALATLSEGHHTPMAGGTELMVALCAGKLPRNPLLSINHLTELRFLNITPESVTVGAGTTFTELRKSAVIASEFTLLSQAASWTGSIANQNRGTLGGNIVNASPAADSPPALLVYDAVLTLISASESRTIPYSEFHLGYKKTALRPDELLHSITLPRTFSSHIPYIRKVGARNAQAISKVALAALARIADGKIEDIRIGAASLRDVPTRLSATEQVLIGRQVTDDLIAEARAALLSETRPIDDIRSTAKYRSAVAANLLEEFLRSL